MFGSISTHPELSTNILEVSERLLSSLSLSKVALSIFTSQFKSELVLYITFQFTVFNSTLDNISALKRTFFEAVSD